MTDKELLELAAKAAGYDVNFAEETNGWYPHGYDHHGDVDTWWNPLKCDGDALRLAVKLGLVITPNYHVEQPSLGIIEFTEIEDSPDPYTPTRRAIVRAAAEIGKAMP
jgi:hypothetical protein